MTRYRTRPVEVEAVQFMPAEWEKTRAFLGIQEGKASNAHAAIVGNWGGALPLYVNVYVRGRLTSGLPGYWIIRAADGSLSVLMDDEFQATYEDVT